MNYGMYTEDGQRVIENLVDMARKSQLPGSAVLNMLKALAKEEAYEEATENVVRERALRELGFNLYETVSEMNAKIFVQLLTSKRNRTWVRELNLER